MTGDKFMYDEFLVEHICKAQSALGIPTSDERINKFLVDMQVILEDLKDLAKLRGFTDGSAHLTPSDDQTDAK
jgi:hypothetical protein